MHASIPRLHYARLQTNWAGGWTTRDGEEQARLTLPPITPPLPDVLVLEA